MLSEFSNLFSNEVLHNTCEAFNQANNLPIAILDVNGIIHAAAGWQDICVNFHRANGRTAELCRESDTALANSLSVDTRCRVSQCKNGLFMAAVPIHVGKHHMGNFFLGQFLLGEPDIAAFEKRAEQYDFDKIIYLESLKRVPVLTTADVDAALQQLVDLSDAIGHDALENYLQQERPLSVTESNSSSVA